MKSRIAAAVVVLSLVAAPSLLAGKGDATAGKAVFDKSCSTCHGANGEGKDAIAKVFKVTLRHLGSKEVQSKSDADLRKIITEGTGKMKPVKLSDAEADNTVAYVRTLAKK